MKLEDQMIRLSFYAAFALLIGCSEPSDELETNTTLVDASKATLSVTAENLDQNRVQFEVQTTIPLPVEMMASVSLKGQKPNDVFIGHSERVTVDEDKLNFIIDTSNSKDPLPAGEYEAELSFYPRWGAKNGNEAANSVPELHAKADIKLEASGTNRANAERKNELQRWVMNNLAMNEPWNRKSFEKRLGPSQKGSSTMSHLHDAYYFPNADVTLLVNRLKNEVTVWRMGNVTE
ncbi:MAG: hypothetical protein CVT76_00495 [Alphaproteobacteria bacterium HGW-Alphaproteobacteria-15]|nr:MAG: hypothetical protein CVT76_00495 [Alphaproteobacteria bacterium HGW-Alphaproteobacteria-15]